MDENLPPVQGTHTNHWSGRIPQAAERLNVEPQLQKPVRSRARGLQQEEPLQREPHAPQLASSPCSLQLEKAHAQQRRPSAATKSKQKAKKQKKYPENLEALLNFPLLTIYKLSRIRSFSHYSQGVPIFTLC